MILDTRPAVYRARMADAYADAPVPVVHWPVLTPRATDVPWPDSKTFDALLLTSRIAVALTPPVWHAHRAYAVGEGTEEAAREAGFSDIVRTGLEGADMVETLKTATFQHAFYPSAAEVSVDLALAFPEKVERRAVYEMVAELRVPDDVAAQLKGRQVIAPLFSRRSAAVLGRLLGDLNFEPVVDVVAISPAVLETQPAPWRRSVIAAQPTFAAMIAAVLQVAREQVKS